MSSKALIPRSLYFAMVMQFSIGGAVVPFVSILLRERGLDFSHISLIFFSASSTLLVFPFLWGMLADRFIPLNRLFLLLNLLIIGGLAIFSAQRSLVGLLITFSLFYACYNPSLTLINALSFHHLHHPQQQFGRVRAWGSIGWMLPSLPIFLWLTHAPKSRLDFVLYLGIAMSVGMVLVSLFLPHTPSGGLIPARPHAPKREYWPAVKRLLSDPDYLVILLSFFLISGSFFLYVFYSPPLLEDLGIARAWIGPIQCIGVVVEIVLLYNLPQMLARWNYANSLLIGCSALMLRHLLFASLHAPWLLAASYTLAGVVIVFYHNSMSILVNAIAGPEVRATAQTILVIVSSGLGPMSANWVAGRLAGPHGLRSVFLFAAVLSGLAAGLLAIRGKNLNRKAHAAHQPVAEIMEPVLEAEM